MPWFKVDDQLATHPKVVQAGNAAMGLWVRAGSWSAQHLTDGHIPTRMLPLLGGTRNQASRLVTAGLWTAVDGGWQFRGWQDYQPSRAHVEDVREKRRKAGQQGGQATQQRQANG